MTTEKIYSPISHPSIRHDIATSPIWKGDLYHEDEERPDIPMYIYTIKFDGLKPVQLLNIEKP